MAAKRMGVKTTAHAPSETSCRRPGVPPEMTEEDFQEVVEVFRILARWRDEERRKTAAAPTAVEGWVVTIGRTRPPCSECRALGPVDHGDALRPRLLPPPPALDPHRRSRVADGDGLLRRRPRGLHRRDRPRGPGPRAPGSEARAIELGLYDPTKPLSPLLEPFINAMADLIVEDLLKHPPPPEPSGPRERRARKRAVTTL
jgi:hypothetical protein